MKTRIDLQKSLVLLLLLFLGIHASKAVGIDVSAPGKISGRIYCAHSNSPAEFISVTIYSVADSVMVAGTISNSDGSFYLSMLGCGEYFIEISETGFTKLIVEKLTIQNNNYKIDLGKIQLEPLIIAGNKNKLKDKQ